MSTVQDEATPEKQWAGKLTSLVGDVAVTKEALLTLLALQKEKLQKKREEDVRSPVIPQVAAQLMELMQGFKHKLDQQLERLEDRLTWLSRHPLKSPTMLNDTVHNLRAGQAILRTLTEDYQNLFTFILDSPIGSCVYGWDFTSLPRLSEKLEDLIGEMLASILPPYKICQGSICHCGCFPEGIPESLQEEEEPSRAKRRKGGALSDRGCCAFLEVHVRF